MSTAVADALGEVWPLEGSITPGTAFCAVGTLIGTFGSDCTTSDITDGATVLLSSLLGEVDSGAAAEPLTSSIPLSSREGESWFDLLCWFGIGEGAPLFPKLSPGFGVSTGIGGRLPWPAAGCFCKSGSGGGATTFSTL